MEAIGERSCWSPPDDATPEQLAEFEAFAARMLVPDETITTWVDVSAVLDQRWEAIRQHVTQISAENPFVRFGRDAWAEFWSREAFVRRESRVPAPDAETDLFAGLEGRAPGPTGWGAGADAAGRPCGAVLADRLAYQGSRSPDAPEQLVQHDLAVARRVQEVRLGLAEDQVRPHPRLDQPRAVERDSTVIPSSVGIDHVWSNTRLPSAYQIGLPL